MFNAYNSVIRGMMLAYGLVEFLYLQLLEELSILLSPSLSLSQATAEANNLTAVAGAKNMYSNSMEQVRTCLVLTSSGQ